MIFLYNSWKCFNLHLKTVRSPWLDCNFINIQRRRVTYLAWEFEIFSIYWQTKDIDHLKAKLTGELQPPMGAIRNIYTPAGGTEVTSVRFFENFQPYGTGVARISALLFQKNTQGPQKLVGGPNLGRPCQLFWFLLLMFNVTRSIVQ